MAKVTIVIEDRPNGGVSCTADPNFETIMAMDMSGTGWTSAHGLAMHILNLVWKKFKTKNNSPLILPGIRS
jgi:hypothetical protein